MASPLVLDSSPSEPPGSLEQRQFGVAKHQRTEPGREQMVFVREMAFWAQLRRVEQSAASPGRHHPAQPMEARRECVAAHHLDDPQIGVEEAGHHHQPD